MRIKTTRTKRPGTTGVTGDRTEAKAVPKNISALPDWSGKVVAIIALVIVACLTSPAQTDVRAYRAPNHIVMALRHLQPNEQWNGALYTEGKERYGVLSWGSSCAVSKDGYLLTANHVVSGGERYVVGGWTDTGKLIPAEVLKRDEKSDLAVIKVSPPGGVPSWVTAQFVETSEIREGMDVFMWGYLAVPGGYMQFLRRGVVSNNTPIEMDNRIVYIETTASFGSSGSPAFLQDGRPVGIVTTTITLPGGLPLPAGVAGLIPGEKVNNILREVGALPAVRADATVAPR
jgi:S1-C subfamily serine protease